MKETTVQHMSILGEQEKKTPVLVQGISVHLLYFFSNTETVYTIQK